MKVNGIIIGIPGSSLLLFEHVGSEIMKVLAII